VELNAFDGIAAMPHAHDFSVVGSGAHLNF
jgi:hypothetical protein